MLDSALRKVSEELIELAAESIGGDDAGWIREHARALKLGYGKFDWRMDSAPNPISG